MSNEFTYSSLINLMNDILTDAVSAVGPEMEHRNYEAVVQLLHIITTTSTLLEKLHRDYRQSQTAAE